MAERAGHKDVETLLYHLTQLIAELTCTLLDLGGVMPEQRDFPADRFARAIAEQARRRTIDATYSTFRRRRYDAVGNVVENGLLKLVRALKLCLAFLDDCHHGVEVAAEQRNLIFARGGNTLLVVASDADLFGSFGERGDGSDEE